LEAPVVAVDQRYEIVNTIAAGDFATVYRARDRELGREVAIKQIHQQFLSDPRQLERFWREAQILASLQHPNILTIYDVVRPRGWLVLELMRGNLQTMTRGQPIDLDYLRTVLFGSLQALQFLHSHGILHGDVKPTNLLVDAQSRVKLGDFGLARRASSQEGSLLKGTTKYMAPELVSNQFGPCGPASDLYSLGFSAYELMCGSQFESLFPGLATFGRDQQIAWLMWHAAPDRNLPEIQRVLEGVPQDLAFVIQGMVVKDPARRFPTAQDAMQYLRPVGGGPIVAPPTQSTGAPQTASKKRLTRIIAIAALACSLLLGGVILFWSPHHKGRPAQVKPVEPMQGIIRSVNLDYRTIVVERSDNSKPQEIKITSRDDVLINGKQQLLGDLQPGDHVRLEPLRDKQSRWFTRFVAARPETSRGKIQEVKADEGRVSIARGPDEAALVVNVPLSLKILVNGSATLNGKPVQLKDVKPGDQATVSHMADERGRTAVELSVLHRVTEQGTIRDLDLPHKLLSFAPAEGGDARLVKLPLADECSVTVNQRSEIAGQLLKPKDLRPGDKAAVTHDTQIVRIDAYRILGQAGVVHMVHDAAGSLDVIVEGDSRPTNYLVSPKCKITLAGERAALVDLRAGDVVDITHDTPGAKNPEAVAIAASRPTDAGRWAILLSVEHYEDASLSKLAYPNDDARLLRESLVQRYRVPADQAVLIADPSQVRLQQGLAEVLARVKAEDEVLVYYAGHACRDKDGTVYLAPANFNHEQMAASGVTLQWLVEQLEKCPAKQKLLLLDAVGDAEEGGSAAEMLQSLSSKPGRSPLRSLSAITNCTEGQQGHNWPAKQHGLFGFTLAEGYSGKADANRDGRIEVSELFAMLTQSMAAAAAEIKFQQTPQLFLPDTKPPRLTDEAKLAIRKLAGFLTQDRLDLVQASSAYSAAKKAAGDELEPRLLAGLVYIKARERKSAERQWNDLIAAHPELLLPLEGLAWLEFDKRAPTAGLTALTRLATVIHKPADDAEPFPPDAARALVFAGQLREFASASVEDKEHLPQEALEKLDAALAALGDAAVQTYEQGRSMSRKIADDFDAKLADPNLDEATRSKIRIERRLLNRYVPFPFEASVKSILDGLDRDK
jgi:serine/threonine-protein kinase